MKLPGLERKKKKKKKSVGRRIENRWKHWTKMNSMELTKASLCLCFHLCFDNTDSASYLAGNSSWVAEERADKRSSLVHAGSSSDACLDSSDRAVEADRRDDLNKEERNYSHYCKGVDSSRLEGCSCSLDNNHREWEEAWIALTRKDWLTKRHSWGRVDSSWELVL